MLKGISNIYFGNKQISNVYKGNLLVYSLGYILEKLGYPLILNNCINKNLIDYQIYGNSIQSNLPKEYQEIEYIESTETQYIDTGFIPNSGSYMVLNCKATKQQNKLFAGSRENVTTNKFTVGSGTSSTILHSNFGSGNNIKLTDFDLNWHEYKISLEGLYLDGILKSTSTQEIAPILPVYLFSVNQGGSVALQSAIQMSYCELGNNGVAEHKFVPCYRITDNEIGLYDTVENKFYENQGTGEFEKGPDISGTPENPVTIASLGEEGYINIKNNGNVTEIDLTGHEPLRKIGDIADYIDYENKQIIRNIGKVVLDGTENWEKSNITTIDRFYTTIENRKKGTNILCNMFTPITDNLYTVNDLKKVFIGTISNSNIFFNYSIYGTTSLEGWKSFLYNNKIEIYYILDTPNYEPIELPKLQLEKGTNILTAYDEEIEASNIYAKYTSKKKEV